tara:strand:+ start:912 stop:1604 length:693 start_codon:yes stop_codon:yes gene_type:complete
MPKILEIIGSPGTGKTFITNELEKIKINKKKIFFTSSQKNSNSITKLNFIFKIFLKLKVILKMIIFYLLFNRRIFLRKKYKRNFFLRVVLINYRDLIYFEYLKNSLSEKKYLIMEPSFTMHFIQDFFYTKESISKWEIKIFNKFFINSSFIINVSCNYKLINKRLNLRRRGFPQRMRQMSLKEKKDTIVKSIQEINKYVLNSKNLRSKIIKVNSSNNINKIKKKILKSIR